MNTCTHKPTQEVYIHFMGVVGGRGGRGDHFFSRYYPTPLFYLYNSLRVFHRSYSPSPPLPSPRSIPPHDSLTDRFVGLVVKALASKAEDPEFKSRLRRDFSGSSRTSDLNIGTPVATLPGAWRYRVSARTGRPGVSIL